MKRYWPGAVMAVIVVASWLAYNAYRSAGKIPDSVFDRMEFGAGFDAVVGDARGVVCHEIRLRTREGEETLVWHKLWKHDFRTMTPEQKRQALKDDTKHDMQDVGLACADPGGKVWLHQAYAQPRCDQCGGGCDVVSCPGTIVTGGGCSIGGINCVVTILCCSGSCGC